ncbi:MAG: hypothetical protein DRQ37_08495 [Gammaproteobacteria bacterium]|nr:MAG: hypothetical protein DRQ37_08495 [Gammaproteobacteria bacterium]
MTLKEFENLVRIGQLRTEPPDKREFEGLLNSARDRLRDARHEGLSFAGRFDLAYNATHALALAALRMKGYRSDKRYMVFQCLVHTLGMSPEQARIFTLCHDRRNLAEYEGSLNVDEQLLSELIIAADELLALVEALSP